MLIGSFEHMLDAKGRVFIPAKWRESVGDTLIVTLGLLETQTACEIDKQGRILIPSQLRDLAGLGKDATLVGIDDHIEIWNPETLAAYNAGSELNYGEDIAHLAALGI